MNNQPKNNSSTPLIIIGLVLLVALGGGWWLYKSSTAPKPVKTGNTNNNTANKATNASATPNFATAPPGAQPPHLLGSPTSTVVVEEFADFQCPTCAKMYPLSKEVISTYGSKIQFIYRNFPLNIPAHDKAYSAAVAAEAAGVQGKFWDMQQQLFTNQQNWTASADFPKMLEEYAQKIGLNVEQFKTDMAGVATKSRVDADIQRGKAVGVNSTPTFFINGKPVPFEQMTTDGMRALIDAELQKAQTSQNAPAGNTANTNTTNK